MSIQTYFYESFFAKFYMFKICTKILEIHVWILFLLEEPSGDKIPGDCRLCQLNGQPGKLGLDKVLIQVVQQAKPILQPTIYVTGFIIIFLFIKREKDTIHLTKFSYRWCRRPNLSCTHRSTLPSFIIIFRFIVFIKKMRETISNNLTKTYPSKPYHSRAHMLMFRIAINNFDPVGHKKIENSEQFQKCIQKPQRENGGERLGRQREGYQPTAGPHPEPDTSRETLHGSLDVNIQQQQQAVWMALY
jgi:hypothetical protein